MKCLKCGFELVEGSKFCPECGESIELENESILKFKNSGKITCSCGKTLNYETNNDYITCIYCDKQHKVI